MKHFVTLKNNSPQILLKSMYKETLEEATTCDLILKCGPELFEYYCHKIVFAASSNFLYEILKTATPGTIPVIILPEIKPATIKRVIEYVYQGEIRLPVLEYGNFEEACRMLEIKGMTEEKDENEEKQETKCTSGVKRSFDEMEDGETDDETEKSENDESDLEEEKEAKTPDKKRQKVGEKFKATPENISFMHKHLRETLRTIYERLDRDMEENIFNIVKKAHLVMENDIIAKAEHECGLCDKNLLLYYKMRGTLVYWNFSNLTGHLKKKHDINYAPRTKSKNPKK